MKWVLDKSIIHHLNLLTTKKEIYMQDQNHNEIVSIDDSDLLLEISITESDMRKAAAEYAGQNPDLIFPNQTDVLPADNMKFYDKLRQSITDWVEQQGVGGGKYLEYILFAPDLFLLLVRLFMDERVSSQLKLLLAFVITYYISPIDAIPEGLVGPVGYIDDIVLACLAILKLIRDTDEKIVREHWSGKGDIIALINKVVNVGEVLVGTSLWGAMKKKLGLSGGKQ